MATNFGVDPGTMRTVIFSGKSVALDEMSAIAYQTKTGELIAAGTDAYEMTGRTPDSVTAVCPIENGVIAEYDLAEHMLSAFLNSVAKNKLFKARLMVAVPCAITEMQKRSLYNACSASGAREVCTIQSPIAAAIALGIDYSKPGGSIIVDIGAGTTEIATISMGGEVKSESCPLAGDSFNQAIARYIKFEHGIIIGPHTAEGIKRQIGCVKPRPLNLTIVSKGRHQFTGLPKTFEISTSEMITALYDTALGICTAIQSVLESSPPEIVGDVNKKGITLIGGGSLLYGLADFITEYTSVRAKCVAQPKLCVAKGTSMALNDSQFLKTGSYSFKSLDEIAMPN